MLSEFGMSIALNQSVVNTEESPYRILARDQGISWLSAHGTAFFLRFAADLQSAFADNEFVATF